jgi:hypothetical protein
MTERKKKVITAAIVAIVTIENGRKRKKTENEKRALGGETIPAKTMIVMTVEMTIVTIADGRGRIRRIGDERNDERRNTAEAVTVVAEGTTTPRHRNHRIHRMIAMKIPPRTRGGESIESVQKEGGKRTRRRRKKSPDRPRRAKKKRKRTTMTKVLRFLVNTD